MEMARSIRVRLVSRLIERVARPAARCSTPTGSTGGRPCRKRRSEAAVAPTSRREAASVPPEEVGGAG